MVFLVGEATPWGFSESLMREWWGKGVVGQNIQCTYVRKRKHWSTALYKAPVPQYLSPVGVFWQKNLELELG